MIISEVVIPRMFMAYAEQLGNTSDGLKHTQYYCGVCDQQFACAWGVSPGCISGYERGTRFHCPYCGIEHSKYVSYIKRHEECPSKVRLSLKTFKDLVILEVFYDAVYFDDVFGIRYRHNGKETFRFDIAKQTATFTSHYDKGTNAEIDMGNPFELDIFKESVLRFFTADSLAIANQKAELTGLLKLLRENIQSRMEKRHKVKSLFVSSGTLRGMFLTPLKNIAFRLTFPDAPNLPAVYRDRLDDITGMWEKHLVTQYDFMDKATEQARKGINYTTWEEHTVTQYDFVHKAMMQARKGSDFVTSVINSTGLPKTAAVRHEIAQNFFECGRLIAAFDLIKNYDYAMRFHAGLKSMSNVTRGTFYNKALFKFLHVILANYGENGLVTLVENAVEGNLGDCIRLYDQLNEESRLELITEHIRIRDLHDWMIIKHRRQLHTNIALNVPDHIVKRLSMQKEALKFFLPKESMELLEAGAKLHNCVASYGNAMKDHKKWIVLVADDKGKLAACLEVVGSKLVQAKLPNNRRVFNDTKLNADVIAWAIEANLEIDTDDVKLTSEELKARAC